MSEDILEAVKDASYSIKENEINISNSIFTYRYCLKTNRTLHLSYRYSMDSNQFKLLDNWLLEFAKSIQKLIENKS